MTKYHWDFVRRIDVVQHECPSASRTVLRELRHDRSTACNIPLQCDPAAAPATRNIDGRVKREYGRDGRASAGECERYEPEAESSHETVPPLRAVIEHSSPPPVKPAGEKGKDAQTRHRGVVAGASTIQKRAQVFAWPVMSGLKGMT